MKKIIIILFLNSFVSTLFSQTIAKEPIKKIDDICFCEIGISHPNRIIYLDNNLDILINLKKGKTLNELSKSNIKYTLSQIKLLWLSELIERKDSIFYTRMPILSTEETFKIRQETEKIAKEISLLIQEDLKLFLESLKLRKVEKNSYSLFFGFVLDGLVWDVLKENNIIEKTKITIDKPFWNGLYWIVDPKRNFSCGTNSLTLKNFSINENWSDNAIISVPSYNMLEQLLDDYIVNGKITKKEVFETFAKNKLFNKNGEIEIPIISKKETDIIYVQSMNITKKIVEYLATTIDYSKFLKSYNHLNKSSKIIILYHEIMWDILDVLEKQKLIVRPVAFKNPNNSKESDLKDLLFIIKE